MPKQIPESSYGVLERAAATGDLEIAAEQVRNLGFAVLDGGYDASQLEAIAIEFETTRERYVAEHGMQHLRDIGESHTVRAPLTHGGEAFLHLALNSRMLAVIDLLIAGKFILNQQNCVINPPQKKYSQGSWHRDLPYQHFVSSRPLAINALFCVDEFTLDNGGTFVLPASHKSEPLPSASYVEKNAVQIEAPAGSYILLDCMLFHSGGLNRTDKERRSVNHVFNIPYFRQQINIAKSMSSAGLTEQQCEILGFSFIEPESVEDYLALRHADTETS